MPCIFSNFFSCEDFQAQPWSSFAEIQGRHPNKKLPRVSSFQSKIKVETTETELCESAKV